ncbi:MAG: DUF6458 family protein [Actinomycetes bacterium]
MRFSIGTGVVLLAIGGVLAFAVRAPDEVEEYVDVIDLGLILMWAGVLVLVMMVVMNRPRRPKRRSTSYDEGQDNWYENDVHRAGYKGETRRLPTVRDGRRR